MRGFEPRTPSLPTFRTFCELAKIGGALVQKTATQKKRGHYAWIGQMSADVEQGRERRERAVFDRLDKPQFVRLL